MDGTNADNLRKYIFLKVVHIVSVFYPKSYLKKI